MINAETSLLVTLETAARRIWRSRRSWKKQLLVTRLTCCFIVSSASRRTSRSRTISKGVMTLSPTDKVRFVVEILQRFAALPNHISSVLPAFSCSHREAHQSRTSRMQLTRCLRERYFFHPARALWKLWTVSSTNCAWQHHTCSWIQMVCVHENNVHDDNWRK